MLTKGVDAFVAPITISTGTFRVSKCDVQYCKRTCVAAVAEAPKAVRNVAAAAAALLVALAPMPAIHSNINPDTTLLWSSEAIAAKGGGDTFLSASGSVNKDGESLLRWSLPIDNRPVRELQAFLESVIADVRGLKWSKMDQDMKRAALVANTSSDRILDSVRSEKRKEAEEILERVKSEMPSVDAAIQQKNAELVVDRQKEVLRDVGLLEELMVKRFPFSIPPEYDGLPQLKGRATVEMVVRKDEGERFDIDGNLLKEGTMTIVLDGYSAPVNAGSFVDLVNKGFYNGLPIIRSDGFIIQSGKPDASDGYVDKATGEVRTIPLEVFAKGDRLPLYGLTLEDDGRGSAPTVLPFSSYGTLAMARKEFEPNTASSQFFWFLFEPDLTPAGRNLLDGSWSVIGYTIRGEKFLKGLQKGDSIVSAKVVDGLENLTSPQPEAQAASTVSA